MQLASGGVHLQAGELHVCLRDKYVDDAGGLYAAAVSCGGGDRHFALLTADGDESLGVNFGDRGVAAGPCHVFVRRVVWLDSYRELYVLLAVDGHVRTVHCQGRYLDLGGARRHFTADVVLLDDDCVKGHAVGGFEDQQRLTRKLCLVRLDDDLDGAVVAGRSCLTVVVNGEPGERCVRAGYAHAKQLGSCSGGSRHFAQRRQPGLFAVDGDGALAALFGGRLEEILVVDGGESAVLGEGERSGFFSQLGEDGNGGRTRLDTGVLSGSAEGDQGIVDCPRGSLLLIDAEPVG